MFKFTLIFVAIAVVSVVCSPVTDDAAENRLDVATPVKQSTRNRAQEELDDLFEQVGIDKNNHRENRQLLFSTEDGRILRYDDLVRLVKENTPEAEAIVKSIDELYEEESEEAD